jgi:hypothetical protein
MRSATTLAAALAAVLALAAGARPALAERDVTNPLTGDVVVMKFATTPTNRELAKIGRKLGRQSLDNLLAACAKAQADKLAGCLSGGK